MHDFDPRVTPARADVAAKFLEGKVAAPRYVEGRDFQIIAPQAPLRQAPRPDAPLDTEALKGERVTVYDENEEGWAWGQLAADNYVGWLPRGALAPPGAAPTHKVAALRTFAFPGPSIKLPPVEAFPLGAKFAVTRVEDRMAVTETGFYIPAIHLKPIGDNESDFVAVAERFLGAPYLWGGKTVLGLDCSGLVQVALAACGLSCPRDTDMQEQTLGMAVGDFELFSIRARRSRILERPRRDHTRRREFASRQRLPHDGGVRADRGSRGPHPCRGQRSRLRAAAREDIIELSMILSENRVPLFGIMLVAARWYRRLE